MYQVSDLEQLRRAADVLEAEEIEYPLSTLIEKSSLSRGETLQLLRDYWINADELDILHLHLTKDEECLLYEDSDKVEP
ncbi:MAG: hypothetical protein ACFB8W_05970 [Elainellaceae cyanobacterium]